MARISAEEAAAAIGNRFDLVLVASQRAREIKNGSRPRIADQNSTPCVAALKEIEEGKYTYNDYLVTVQRKKKGHRDEYFPT
jgi:DNA-directed RNA polymerase subunit omega